MTERLLESGIWSVEHGLDGFKISHGWTEDIKRQIPLKSLQKHVFRATPKDAEIRFKDDETLENWLATKNPDAYALSFSGDLAGIVWHRPEAYPLPPNGNTVPGHTFAVRIYKPYEGRKLSYPFMDACLRDYIYLAYERGEMDNFGVWLTTRADPRMIRYYERYGYFQTGINEKQEPIMVLSEGKIREVLGA